MIVKKCSMPEYSEFIFFHETIFFSMIDEISCDIQELRMLTMNYNFISYHRPVTTGWRWKCDFQLQRSDIKRSLIDRIFSYMPHKQRFVKTPRPAWNGRHLPDDIFTCVFLNQKYCILIKMSPNFITTIPHNNEKTLVQVMTGRGRRQVFAWVNDDLVLWRMYSSGPKS